jgi:DNA-binding transcriptional LysR family regulator
MPRFDLNGLEVFAAVIDAGGFTAASRRMGISKSAVSKQIGALEDRLGTRLLNRTTRKLSPTEAGLAVYERAVRIIAEAEDAEAAVGDLAASPRGRLRLNAAQSFGIRHLGAVISAFHEAYPELEVELVLSDRIIDLVDEGFDVAIRIARLKDSSLIARRIMPVERYIIASPDYLARAGRPRSPADLAGHACLAYSLQDRPHEWRCTGAGGHTEVVRFTPKISANDGDVLLGLVERGAGIALLPDFIIDAAVAEGRVEVVLADRHMEPIAVHAVYPAVRHLATKVRVFVDFLVDWFAKAPAPVIGRVAAGPGNGAGQSARASASAAPPK